MLFHDVLEPKTKLAPVVGSRITGLPFEVRLAISCRHPAYGKDPSKITNFAVGKITNFAVYQNPAWA